MSRRRRRQLLVPEARAALDQLKFQVIDDKTDGRAKQGATGMEQLAQNVQVPYNACDNGEMTTRQAGKLGGEIGGTMISRLIEIAERELASQQRPR